MSASEKCEKSPDKSKHHCDHPNRNEVGIEMNHRGGTETGPAGKRTWSEREWKCCHCGRVKMFRVNGEWHGPHVGML
jgi:hypothetical protein